MGLNIYQVTKELDFLYKNKFINRITINEVYLENGKIMCAEEGTFVYSIKHMS